MLSLSSSARPLELIQIGPNTFEVRTENVPENDPSDLVYGSSSGSSFSLPSSSTALHPPALVSEPSEAPESEQEKRIRKNKERCKSFREKQKKKAEEQLRELERLKERNQELKATVQGMEEVVALLKDASRKRRGEGGTSDDQGRKKKRQ